MNKTFPFVVFVIMFFGKSFAADDSGTSSRESEVVTKLAGAESREWIFADFETQMGTDGKCKNGESYRFKRDHTLIILRCVAGNLVTEHHQWKISHIDSLDTIIEIDHDERLLLFYQKNGVPCMALRAKARNKTEPTRDMEFHLDQE